MSRERTSAAEYLQLQSPYQHRNQEVQYTALKHMKCENKYCSCGTELWFSCWSPRRVTVDLESI